MSIPQVEFQIKFSDQALDYIMEHGGTITLEEAPQTGCCTNYVFIGVHPGKPQDEGYFGIKDQAGIKIFYDPFVIKKDKQYEVVLEGFLKWKTLRIYS